MKISLFTPTHNPIFLDRVMSSLRKQTYTNWEWVIAPNNGISVPNFDDSRVKIFPCEKSDNIGFLKNFAASKTTGEIVVEMDHDDELFPTALEECYKAFLDPTVDFVFSNCCDVRENYEPRTFDAFWGWEFRECFYENKKLMEMVSFPPDPRSFSKIWYAPNHFRAWKKSFYDAIGGHDVNLDILDDQDIMCRTYIKGKVYHIDKPLYVYHIHEGNTCYGEKNARIQEMTLELHDKYIYPLVEKWCDLNKLRKIDLCGGFSKPDGYESVDKLGGDIEADLNEKWPFEDGTVGVFRAHDALEHLKDPIHVMKEAYRCLAPNGWFLTQTPSTDGRGAFQDPTHCCHSEDTECLTIDGFKNWESVTEEDLIATLNIETNVVEYLQPTRLYKEFHKGDMIHFLGRHIDCLVTSNHRMIVGSSDDITPFKVITAEETSKYRSVLRIPSNALFEGDYPEYFEIPKSRHINHQNPGIRFPIDTVRLPIIPFLKFLGWFLSEGWAWIGKDKFCGYSRIGIAQSETANPYEYEKIGRDILELGYKPYKTKNGWCFHDCVFAKWLKNLGHSHEKYIPQSIKQLHPELLKYLIQTMLLGDGRGSLKKGLCYSSCSPKLASDFQEIAIKCGYRTTISREVTKGKICSINPDYRSNHDMNHVYITKCKEMYLPRTKNIVPYEGYVYCAEMPKNHILMTRRNGKTIWTGNSFFNSNSFWYYTKAEQAKYINTPVKFQLNRIKNFFPSDWHRFHNIVYVKADLLKFSGRTPGGIEI